MDIAQPTERRGARAALVWAAVGLTVAFAYLAVKDVDWSEAWNALAASDIEWVVPAFAAMVAALAVRAARWWSVFARETRPPFRAISDALLVGYFYNTILPLRAGEAIRVVDLGRRSGVSRVEALATVAVERAMDVVALLVLFFVASPWLPEVSWLRAAAVLGAVLALVIGAAVASLAIWGVRPIHALLRPFARFARAERIEAAAGNLAQGLVALRHARVAAEAFTWTMLSWALLSLSFWLMMLGFDLDVSPLAGLLVLVATGLAMILPSPPAALGVFEAAAVVALGAYGVSASHALPYAVVLHLLNSIPFLLAAPLVLRSPARAQRGAREA